jgi:IK cytokine
MLSSSKCTLCTVNFSSGNGHDEEVKPKQNNNSSSKHHLEREMLPPPPPLKNISSVNEKQKLPPPVISREEDDDIFVGEGVKYSVPTKETNGSPVLDDMAESPRQPQERQSYFDEPAYGPVPPSEPTYTWQPTVSSFSFS